MVATECKVHKFVSDVAALSAGMVLFVRYVDRSKYDGQMGWFLPDDYLSYEEHPREGARRILREQAGIEADVNTLNHIESFAGGPGGAWHIIFHYKVDLPNATRPSLGPNVEDAKWFPVTRLPPRKEFAHEGWGIDVLREILRT